MRAIVVREPGGVERLELAEVPDPVCGPGQVLIDVHAAGLNRADLLQRRGLYPPPPGESSVLGLECAGTVVQVGSECGSLAVGQRVMALLGGGGYAERVAIPEGLAIPVPDALGLERAAAIPEAFLTASEAVSSLGRAGPGDWALVHGAAGGVGSAAVQLLARAGARVIATTRSAAKCALAASLGAEVSVSYEDQGFADAVAEHTDGRGVDLIVDLVGAAYADQHARCLAVGGRWVIVGLLGGARATIDFGKILMRRQQLLGLVMRSRPVEEKIALTRRFIRELLPAFVDGTLRPVIDSVFAWTDVAEAHRRMEQNAHAGKIVLKVR